jgi:RimJ/RimL family protein N-acetyltransferase
MSFEWSSSPICVWLSSVMLGTTFRNLILSFRRGLQTRRRAVCAEELVWRRAVNGRHRSVAIAEGWAGYCQRLANGELYLTAHVASDAAGSLRSPAALLWCAAGKLQCVSQTIEPFLPSFTPKLQLETLFVLDGDGRIRATREPNPTGGPAFSLVRDKRSCAWALSADVPSELADELIALARSEPPPAAITDPPRHADAYVALLGGRAESGPVFTFPRTLAASDDVATVTALSALEHHFRGWTADEIPERSPIVGIAIDGHAVSVCFCARRSEIAAEAGVETAVEYRGRGFGSRVTAAWGRLIRDSGRLPLYSTSWSNTASIALASKLGMSACGTDWNVYDGAG